jgi:hypothetical protein
MNLNSCIALFFSLVIQFEFLSRRWWPMTLNTVIIGLKRALGFLEAKTIFPLYSCSLGSLISKFSYKRILYDCLPDPAESILLRRLSWNLLPRSASKR